MSADYASATVEWNAGSITLLELMKQFQGIADASKDDEYSMFLQMSGELAESYIDNKLVLQEVSENFISTCSPIGLRFYPVGGLTSVVNDGTDESSDWDIYAEDGIYWITKGDVSGLPFNQLTVTYEAGFDPIPSDIGYALVQIAINYEENAGSSTGQVKKEVINGVGSIEYAVVTDGDAAMIKPATIGALSKYMRIHA